jgi:hypothetical protein
LKDEIYLTSNNIKHTVRTSVEGELIIEGVYRVNPITHTQVEVEVTPIDLSIAR